MNCNKYRDKSLFIMQHDIIKLAFVKITPCPHNNNTEFPLQPTKENKITGAMYMQLSKAEGLKKFVV